MSDIVNDFIDKNKSEAQGVKFIIDIIEDRQDWCFKFAIKLSD